MKNRVFVDITELINFSKFSDNVTGIQRVMINLCKELEAEPKVELVFYDAREDWWFLIHGLLFNGENELDSVRIISDNWKSSRIKWSQTRKQLMKKSNLLRKSYLISNFIKSLTLRKFINKSKICLGDGVVLTPLATVWNDGGVLLIPSIPNVSHYKKTIGEISHKLKVVYFFHDVIQAVAPEFVSLKDRKNFEEYIEMMHESASALVTSAKYNVEDYLSYIERHCMTEIKYKISAIGLPVDFNVSYSLDDFDKISPISRCLSHYKYCLCVGSVGPRKNHFELLQAWKKFYDSDAYNNEVLVVAGSVWETAPEMARLLRNDFCNGSVVFVEAPCDKELSYLYDHAKFTVCVSLYEGWGLPVSESIAAGKPVVIYDETTLPEAGYGAANVVKSRDLKALRGEIERLFGDEAYYAESFKKVQEVKAKLPTWKDFAYKLLSQIDEIQ